MVRKILEFAQSPSRIQVLEQKVDALLKIFYGVKSEKIERAQLQLLLEGCERKSAKPPLETKKQQPEEGAEARPTNKKTKAKNHSRLKGWDQLEVIEETILPEGYEQDKDQLELVGLEITERLDYEPARLLKRRYIRPKFRRKDDRHKPPLVAPAPSSPPSSPLAGGVPTFALTDQLIISKYADPLSALSTARHPAASRTARSARHLEPLDAAKPRTPAADCRSDPPGLPRSNLSPS